MCSICPHCHPSEHPDGVSFGPFSSILPVPVELPDSPWGPVMPILPVPVPADGADPPPIRRFDYPVGGVFCRCPQDESRAE
jgi:hypothetical protein